MRYSKLFTTIPLLLLIFLSLSCSDSTKPKKASVVGVVVLEGLNSFEGVSVLLYKAGFVNEDLQAVHNEHPSVGFELADIHVFDHRKYAPLYSTFTDIDGRFELKGVQNDKYILVLLKEGYGPSYTFDIDVNGEYYDVSPTEPISLFEIVVLPQYVSENMVFEAGIAYIADEVTFLPDSHVVLSGGSKLMIKPGGWVTCHGTISFEGTAGNPIRISSSDRMFETNVDVAQFAKFEITELANSSDIEGLLFSHSTDGMIIKSTNLTLRKSVFARNNIGCMFTIGHNIAIEGTYFTNSEGIIGKGLVLQDVADTSLENCVFYNVEKVSLSIVIGQDVTIFNCFFTGGQNHILNSFSSQTLVTNSTFSNAAYNLTNTARSILDIQYNDIEGRVCIYTYHTGNQGNSISNGWTKANNNNFNASEQTVRATAQFYTYQHVYVPLDFINNFWGTTSQAMIEESIIDFNDLEPYPEPGNIWPLIEYAPFRTSRVVNAGVQ